MRFLHIADVHLDTTFSGRSEEVRTRLRQASREAFGRCVEAAVAEKVDAVLVAGDLFDGGRLSLETERFLLQQVARLEEAEVQFVYAAGNHDPGAAPREGALEWPANAAVISSGQPETVAVRGRGGEVAGYVTGAGHATAEETEDLSRRMRPKADTRLPQAALLHTLASAAGDAGVHRPYAPSRIADLQAAGFHYWALGHVHVRQALSDEPPIWYPGNLQGRNPGETGPKGGMLVDLSEPERPAVEFREFAPVRWEKASVSALEEASTLRRLAAAAVRSWEAARKDDPGTGVEWMATFELGGPSPLWAELRRPDEAATLEDEIARRLGALGVEVRAERLHPPVRVADHVQRRDVLGAVLRLAAQVSAGEEELGVSEGELAGYSAEQHGSVGDYFRELMKGAPEEAASRMLDAEQGGT